MRKIKLTVEDLRVESFNVASAPTTEGGTVRGHAMSLVCEPSEYPFNDC